MLYTISSIITGILIISKYFKHKDKTLLLVGLAIIGISCPWWPSTISYLMILIFKEALPPQPYFLIGNAFVPVFTYCWILAINILLFGGKNKRFLTIYAIIFIIFEIVFFFLLFTNYDLIGYLELNYIDVHYYYVVMGLLVLIVITVLVTGLMVAHRSIFSKDPKIQLKGKILGITFTLWSICATIDAVAPPDPIGIETAIVRTILIINSLFFYIGWIMPKFALKIFIKLKILEKSKKLG